jgi:hypothetical protein
MLSGPAFEDLHLPVPGAPLRAGAWGVFLGDDLTFDFSLWSPELRDGAAAASWGSVSGAGPVLASPLTDAFIVEGSLPSPQDALGAPVYGHASKPDPIIDSEATFDFSSFLGLPGEFIGVPAMAGATPLTAGVAPAEHISYALGTPLDWLAGVTPSTGVPNGELPQSGTSETSTGVRALGAPLDWFVGQDHWLL